MARARTHLPCRASTIEPPVFPVTQTPTPAPVLEFGHHRPVRNTANPRSPIAFLRCRLMTTPLHHYIKQALGEKTSAVIRISEIEQLGGEDWLLEVSAQAEQLKLQVMPHPQDTTLVLIERERP